MTINSNIPATSTSKCSCGKFHWSNHAMERKEERHIHLNPSDVSIEYVKSLPHYTNNGCYHYCDSKEGITYYVRGNDVVTVIKRNPIAMARRICEIKGWNFNRLCRDHLFGNCKRGDKCKYEHMSL
jgi:hypothetical protein